MPPSAGRFSTRGVPPLSHGAYPVRAYVCVRLALCLSLSLCMCVCSCYARCYFSIVFFWRLFFFIPPRISQLSLPESGYLRPDLTARRTQLERHGSKETDFREHILPTSINMKVSRFFILRRRTLLRIRPVGVATSIYARFRFAVVSLADITVWSYVV